MQLSHQSSLIKYLAFYLPQFHPIPENNNWWGNGFTEWKNVVNAKPLFKGHYQPHIPSDLGFYDLRLPDIREQQTAIAKQYGIHGFCYYHYWFNGKRLLERPFNEVLSSGKPDFPFCLFCANENWSRNWDGGHDKILVQQHYSHEDDRNHIKALIPAFKDKRYIKIFNKPVFLVYRTELMPDPKKTAEIWQEEAVKAGLKGIYFIRVESSTSNISPESIGFDASTEFAPDWQNMGKLYRDYRHYRILAKLGLINNSVIKNWVSYYEDLSSNMLSKTTPDYVRYRCVTPMWDNSARRKSKAAIFLNSTPEKYERWLFEASQKTIQERTSEERILFINAWNEWGEGCHLEPDQRWGLSYLEKTKSVFAKFSKGI